MRYGVDPIVAKYISMNELRNWELTKLKLIFDKVKRNPKTFCPFTDPERFLRQWRRRQDTNDKIRSLWPTVYETSSPWLAPPRSLIVQAAREKAALCINSNKEWSIRRSDYLAISHAWIEGLQQDEQRKAVRGNKIDLVFKTLARAGIQTKWIWTDVLAIPDGGGPTNNLDDDLLKTEIINSMPEIYANAEGIAIFDALAWQLQTRDLLELAVAIVCGTWVSRVWTYQEVKFARKALIVNGWYHAASWAEVTKSLKAAAAKDPQRFHGLWLIFQIMGKDDAVNICVRDVFLACQRRSSGQDVDYARAFFPIFGLEWRNGMTREEGMQKIYRSQMRDATRMIFSYGHPRMKLIPAWAPSYISGLEGIITEPMLVEDRGIRGDLFVAQISSVKHRSTRFKRIAMTLSIGEGQVQCAIAPSESEDTVKNLDNAIDQGRAFMISHEPSKDHASTEFARPVLLVEKADVAEHDGFEAAVHCSALVVTQTNFPETEESVLLRHASPLDGDLDNQIQYILYTQTERSIPTQLAAQNGESVLHAAARNGVLEVVEGLLSKGHRIEVFDSRGWTPLHVASARGNIDVLCRLVSDIENVDIPGQQMSKDSPLGLAAQYDKADAIEVLHCAGADIEVRNNCDYTPLMVAAREGCSAAVKKLIELGAAVNCHNKLESALFLLCASTDNREGRLEILNMLLDAGAHPNGNENSIGWTPLHKAAEWADEAMVSILLAKGANVNAQMNGSLHTPLRIAIDKNRRNIVRLLLNAGANCNTVFQDNWTPAHMAAKCPDFDIMRMLLEEKVDLDVKLSDKGWTPLHVATFYRHGMIVKSLLEAGADVGIVAVGGKTPLGLAEELGAGDLVDTFRHFARGRGRKGRDWCYDLQRFLTYS